MTVLDEEDGNISLASGFESTATAISVQEQLAARETLAVQISRWLVLLALLGSAVTVCTSVYLFTRNNEVDAFEETFAQYATQVTNTVHRNAQHKLEGVAAIALQIQAYAISSGSVFPNVTMPFFEEHVLATQSLTDAYGVQLFPIVTNETRKQWEAYSVENRNWLNDSYATQRYVYDGKDQSQLEANETAQPDFDWFGHLWGPEFYNDKNPDFSQGIANQIFGTRFNEEKHPIVDPNPGPYFPHWQTAPASWYYQTTVNSNYGNFADFLNQTKIVIGTETAAFGMAWEDGNTPGYISTMMYPIFDSFYAPNRSVAAFLGMDLFWQAFIEHILPPSAEGIYVVIRNAPPCDQEFTFELAGDTATYIGDGDHHVPIKFDDLEVAFLFGSELMEPVTEPTYTGRPLYHDFCPYTFRLYPSQQMEDRFRTNDPILYSAAAFFTFFLTVVAFFIFDRCVEKKNRRIILTAMTQLEEANISIVHASEQQLQHFAMMSHEIRYAINAMLVCLFVRVH